MASLRMGGVDGAKTSSSLASVRSSQMGNVSLVTSLDWMLDSEGAERERFKGQPSQVGTCP